MVDHLEAVIHQEIGVDDCLELARIAEQVDRYEDMAQLMRRVVKSGRELSLEERNLLSVAYKNLIGCRRTAWRTLAVIVESTRSDGGKRHELAKEYWRRIEGELKDICVELLGLLDQYLIPSAQESELFYLKLKGDLYRYLSDIATGEEQKKFADASKAAYDEAFHISRTQLPATDPIRLGLVLSHSVFSYEILNQPERAYQLAKEAFDAAIAELDSLSAENYKDSTLIMQLLRDNLTLWERERAESQSSVERGKEESLPSVERERADSQSSVEHGKEESLPSVERERADSQFSVEHGKEEPLPSVERTE